MRREDAHRYDDIIGLPHPVSQKHPQMPLRDRAAQFSPFAALTGYEDAVDETARLTDQRIELAEDARAALNAQLAGLAARLASAAAAAVPIAAHPLISVTYFVPDAAKAGGAYLTELCTVKRLDEAESCLLLSDGRRIPLQDILQLEEIGP